MNRFILRLTGGVCAVLALASSALAALPPLPDVGVIGTVLFNRGGRIDTSSLGIIALDEPALGSLSFNANGPSSLAHASAQVGPSTDALLFGRGGGILRFGFAIDGPTPTVDVLIDIVGWAVAAASPGANLVVAAGWELYDSPGMTTLLASDQVQSGQIPGSFSQGFNRTVALTLDTQHVYFVSLNVDAEGAAIDAGSSVHAEAFVDPFFRFGAGVDTQRYSFGFSAGVANAPVPEPAAALLMGIGVLGLWARRRRA